MNHLYSYHPMNRHITTMTFETRLRPVDKQAFVTPTMLKRAQEHIATNTSVNTKGFKNSFQVSISVKSNRPNSNPRRVSVKVFKNLRLHITGTHSIDMVDSVISLVSSWLNECLTTVEEDSSQRQIDVVLYKYQLPAEINMHKLQNILDTDGVFNIYNPQTYAGIRVKLPIDDLKYASIMFFRKGKVIIIIPKQPDFDESLQKIMHTIDATVSCRWELIKYTS